jgi:hypothetical protein
MPFDKFIRPPVGADLSALAGFSAIQIKKLKSINQFVVCPYLFEVVKQDKSRSQSSFLFPFSLDAFFPVRIIGLNSLLFCSSSGTYRGIHSNIL